MAPAYHLLKRTAGLTGRAAHWVLAVDTEGHYCRKWRREPSLQGVLGYSLAMVGGIENECRMCCLACLVGPRLVQQSLGVLARPYHI